MSKQTWRAIQSSKRFYVRGYRKIGSMLLLSVIINALLGMEIYHLYFNLPDSDFYATYGEVPPVLLKGLDEPNYTSTPLLGTDRQFDSDKREIPR